MIRKAVHVESHSYKPWHGYQISLQLERSLDSFDDPEMLVDEVKAEIGCFDEVDFEPVGEIEAKILRTSESGEGCSNFDIFDCVDQHIFNFYDYLFDRDTDEFKPHIAELLDDTTCGDIIIVDYMELEPEHRHKGVGLAAILELLRLIADESDTIVLWPAPRRMPEKPEEVERLKLEEFVPNHKLAKKKLDHYFARLGFRPLPNTPLLIHNMIFKLASVEEALAKP